MGHCSLFMFDACFYLYPSCQVVFSHAHWLDRCTINCHFYGMEFTLVINMGVLSCFGVIASIPLAFCFFPDSTSSTALYPVGTTIAGIVLLVLSDDKAVFKSSCTLGKVLLMISCSLLTLSSIILKKVLKTGVS